MEEIRRFSGLGDAFDRPVKSYSAGMALRLGFSVAIHSSPEILLIDEALAVGDAFFQQRCLRRMRELRESGVTIVLVSHDPSAVISLCDRALWLEQGGIAAAGRPDEVVQRYLAARYRDDCELGEPLQSVAELTDAPARAIAPAPAPGRVDDRFGDGRARVEGAELRDEAGRPRGQARPGEPCQMVLTIRAYEHLVSPLVGFTMRNRLGDVVSATNTELEGIALPSLEPGDEIDVAFRFAWPPLASGPLSFSPAVAEGSIAAHVMCDWIENALIVESENPRGLFGWLTLEDVEASAGLRPSPKATSGGTGADAESDPPLPTETARLEFALDEPRGLRVEPDRITERREVFFSGWCFATDGSPVEVVISVDGGPEKIISPSLLRDDVARVHAAVPAAARSGFGVLVPLPGRPGRVHGRIEVRGEGALHVVRELELDLPATEKPLPPAVGSPRARRRARDAGSTPRVLFVSHSLNLEGAPRSLFELAGGLDRERFDVRLLSPVEGPLEAVWKEAGFATRILPVDPRAGRRDDYDAMVRRLAGLVSPDRPDLVVANTLETFWAIHLAEELGVPSIWIVRESEDPAAYFHSRWPTVIAERGVAALDLADSVIFVAEATRDLFRGRLDEERTRLIPNGLDLARFDLDAGGGRRRSTRRRLGIPDARLLILCVGTTCMRKGQLDLIRALDRMKTRVEELACVFLGAVEGDYLERLKAAADELGLADRVQFLPPREDPLPCFEAADLLVSPSYQESLPRVVLEAMAFGLPIVATGVHGVPELVRHDEEALLVEPGDVEAMADAISELLLDPARAARLGERARKRVEAQFTLRRSVDRYAESITALLARDGMGDA
jgi:glycosyltransferase involved in cell wall biosynthesis